MDERTVDDTLLNRLYTLRRRGIKVGLHRTEALLAKCGNPHRDVPVIHIAGTNGKGSTAAMIASILKSSGRKVGLYTSPHLVRYNERIRIDGTPVIDETVVKFLNSFATDIDTLGSTFFETTTALAFSYFAHSEVDVAVIEVGLGGQLDSSNVAHSVLTVLMPIHYDHMEYLGHDLSAIAREKCGIFKTNVPAVTSSQLAEVTEVIESSATDTGVQLHKAPDICPLESCYTERKGSRFLYNGTDLVIPLIGQHQITNAQTAIAASLIFDRAIEMAAIAAGLREVHWPARLQQMSTRPLIFYDVAHNPHGLDAVFKTLQQLFPSKKIGAVYALKKSKHLDEIVRLLKEYCHTVIATVPDHDEFFDLDVLTRKLNGSAVAAAAAPKPQAAFSLMKEDANGPELWLIFGTHYIAKDVFDYFRFPFDNGQI